MSLGSLIHSIAQFDQSFFRCNQPLFSGHQSIFSCHQSLFSMVYYYDLTEEEGAHEKAFYSALQPIMETQNVSRKLFFKKKYNDLLHVCKSVRAGVPLKDLRHAGYLQAGPWSSKYVVASFRSSDVVLVRGTTQQQRSNRNNNKPHTHSGIGPNTYAYECAHMHMSSKRIWSITYTD
jgi:hypothetical protein